MSKKILSGSAARAKLLEGINLVHDVVKVTMGPRGRNVAYENVYGVPTITNDGVSIVKEMSSSDRVVNMGIEMVKEVASKTNDVSGDGTTTASVLLSTIAYNGIKQVELGANPLGLRLGMEAACEAVLVELEKGSVPITDRESAVSVASISAESRELGELIADTVLGVGYDGVVTVSESPYAKVTASKVDGVSFEKGYISPYMVTDKLKMEATYKDVGILVCEEKIGSINDVVGLLEKLIESGRKDLVIIADEISDDAIAAFVVNKVRNSFSVLAVRAPYYGDKKKEFLRDIAVMTGASIIGSNEGNSLGTVGLDVLGYAMKVTSTKDKTVIVDSKGDKEVIESHIKMLKQLASSTETKFEKDKLEERLARVSGGVAVIHVGALTEAEMKYRKLKVEDAVNATVAATKGGVVAGGGVALFRAANNVDAETLPCKVPAFQADFLNGVNIVLNAMSAPMKQIIINAGRVEDYSVVLDHVKSSKGLAGYNALTNEYVKNMIKEGIVDPLLVTKSALTHAVSSALTLITTEVVVYEDIKEGESGVSGGVY